MNRNNDPRVLIRTELGDILLELHLQQAPITVRNFLRYIEEERFAPATFHRVVRMDNQPNSEFKIEVVQGGLKEDNHPLNLPPIPHETTQQTGILHKDGIISMARNEPGSAQSDFFICLGDQPELDFGGRRNPDGQGFAAFGQVVEGMEVVHRIYNSPIRGQNLEPNIPIIAIKVIEEIAKLNREEIHSMDEINETEERPSAVIECPHCHVKVLPMANNICPACRENILDTQGVDPNQVSLTIHESEDLPSFCYSCNLYTDRTVKISGDGESALPSLFTQPEVGTSNVIIYLPQCDRCAEAGEPEPLDVDYEYQKMTFVVHKGFRDRVFQMRESQPKA